PARWCRACRACLPIDARPSPSGADSRRRTGRRRFAASKHRRLCLARGGLLAAILAEPQRGFVTAGSGRAFETVLEDRVVAELANCRLAGLEQRRSGPFGMIDERVAVALETLDRVIACDFVRIGRVLRVPG